MENGQHRAEGHRVLFVSNRTDPTLYNNLKEKLGVEHLQWCIAKPKKLQSAARSVKSGKFTLVMSQTGFVGHDVEDILVDAAKKAGIPLLRVDKGRVRQVEEALENSDIKPLSKPKKKRKGGRGPNWSGAELALVEEMALAGRTDNEIAAEINAKWGIARSHLACRSVRLEYFGIGLGGKKVKTPSKDLPQAYHDIVQARRIQEGFQKIEDEHGKETRDFFESAHEDKQKQDTPQHRTEPVEQSRTSSTVTVTIDGPDGTALIETRKSRSEVIAFLLGY